MVAVPDAIRIAFKQSWIEAVWCRLIAQLHRLEDRGRIVERWMIFGDRQKSTKMSIEILLATLKRILVRNGAIFLNI